LRTLLELNACTERWQAIGGRRGVAREVYGWTDADNARFGELLLKGLSGEALTREERGALEKLEAKVPPRKRQSKLASECTLSRNNAFR